MTQDEIRQLKNYDIKIEFFDQGCVVKVGCKSFAFRNVEQAIAELTAYTKDPIGVGKKYAPEHFVGPKECLEQGCLEQGGLQQG